LLAFATKEPALTVVDLLEDEWELIETTEHKRTEEELRDAMEKLKKSISDLGQFAYVAFHDLQ
jgi:hypothetical protein